MATVPALPSGITFSTLERTGAITPAQANPIRKAYEKILSAGPSAKERDFAKHAVVFMQSARSVGEGAVFGSLLGFVHGAMPGGLDARVPFLQNKHTIPVDGVLAGLGLIAATATANHESGIAGTFTSAAASASTIYGFRKVNDMVVALKQARSGATPGGGAAPVPGKIGKAEFAGEDQRTRAQGRRFWGAAKAAKTDIGADPLVSLADGL